MFDVLKKTVYEANMELYRRNLVVYTWGNVSQIDRAHGVVAIKPSGVPYETMTADQIVLLDLETGRPIEEGSLHPSSDAPTHLVLYRCFSEVGGVTHTHSPYATAWAQAGMSIPCFGTTHADYFRGEIPVSRFLTSEETESAYEANTGKVIVETFEGRNPMYTPAVLTLGKNCVRKRAQRRRSGGARQDGSVHAGVESQPDALARPHQRQAFLSQARPERLLWSRNNPRIVNWALTPSNCHNNSGDLCDIDQFPNVRISVIIRTSKLRLGGNHYGKSFSSQHL